MHLIHRVALIGGIHGNELTGAYLIRKFAEDPRLIHRPSFETLTLLGNPEALAANRRYVDTDLNRCFLTQDLTNPDLERYEEQQAKRLSQTLNPEDRSPVDFILDLHTSTANMGQTLVLVNHHPFNLRLAAYLSALNPDVRVFSWTHPEQDPPFIIALAELGFVLEMGPIAPGLLCSDRFQQTETLVHQVLDYLDDSNQTRHMPAPQTLTLYQYTGTVDYPRNSRGDLQAMIHPHLQNRDYEILYPGDPMFLTFAGETITYDGPITWPIFINEASYYEKGIAFCLTQKQDITLQE